MTTSSTLARRRKRRLARGSQRPQKMTGGVRIVTFDSQASEDSMVGGQECCPEWTRAQGEVSGLEGACIELHLWSQGLLVTHLGALAYLVLGFNGKYSR